MNTFTPAGLAFARIVAALPVPFGEDDEPKVPGTPRENEEEDQEEAA